MHSEPSPLVAIPFPGLAPETLGNYLASLGLMRVTARKWPNVRGAWNGSLFHLINGPATLDDLLDHLCIVATQKSWTPYTHDWADAQKKSTKLKSGATLALWLARAEESEIEMFAAHAVPTRKVNLNPLLGTGGNSGKRNFSDGWVRAIEALAKAKKGAPDKRLELKALLAGETVTWLIEKLNAASWFSDANKIYNSGQAPYREGALSPWSMVLACEGLPFFAGAASRRLGAQARAAGAFPFVTYAAAAESAGEAGRDVGEVWAPLWNRPMTVREVATLFSRGRAEVRGRGVLTPCAFAVAALRRGVDAGITEFRRFALGRTTSANTFESRFEGEISVTQDLQEIASTTPISTALDRVLALVEQLPKDQKKGDRWRFLGLRGPVERALVRSAAEPLDSAAACALLDAVVSSLDRVDRVRAYRDRRISWEPLPLTWLPFLFSGALAAEPRLALACASSFPAEQPLATYRFGVERKGRSFVHVETPPARWVWRAGPFTPVLCDVLGRRILDWEKVLHEGGHSDERVRPRAPAGGAHVDRWIGAAVDEDLLARWISRLALFDWRFVPREVRSLAPSAHVAGATGNLLLFGLIQPLFDLRPVRLRTDDDLLPEQSGARTPGAARELFNLLRTGRVDAAVRIAASRYSMAGVPLVRTAIPWSVGQPDRLLASLLFTVFESDRAALVERWLRPRRKEGDVAYG